MNTAREWLNMANVATGPAEYELWIEMAKTEALVSISESLEVLVKEL